MKSKVYLNEKEMTAIINVFRIYEVKFRSGLIKAEHLMKAMNMLGLNPTEWEVGQSVLSLTH